MIKLDSRIYLRLSKRSLSQWNTYWETVSSTEKMKRGINEWIKNRFRPLQTQLYSFPTYESLYLSRTWALFRMIDLIILRRWAWFINTVTVTISCYASQEFWLSKSEIKLSWNESRNIKIIKIDHDGSFKPSPWNFHNSSWFRELITLSRLILQSFNDY